MPVPSDTISSALFASLSPVSMISRQLLEKSTALEHLGSYLGFPVFFLLLKNNKAGPYLGGSGDHRASLLFPASFCCFAQKELQRK